ncbi:MAG: PilZ domain-containing protein [Bdellovibrionales bacterium]
MKGTWSLFNKVERLRIDDLRTAQVKIILLAIPTRKMKDWVACRSGEIHWRSLRDIAEFCDDVQAIKGEATVMRPAAGEAKSARRPLFEDPPLEMESAPTLMVEKQTVKERRSARRYNRQLEFAIQIGENAFSCETVDLSMNGLSLAEDLPDWVPPIFRAHLAHNEQVSKIRCERVNSIQLKILEAESWDLIRRWLVNW